MHAWGPQQADSPRHLSDRRSPDRLDRSGRAVELRARLDEDQPIAKDLDLIGAAVAAGRTEADRTIDRAVSDLSVPGGISDHDRRVIEGRRPLARLEVCDRSAQPGAEPITARPVHTCSAPTIGPAVVAEPGRDAASTAPSR